MAQTAIEYGPDRLRLLEFDGAGKRLRVLDVVDVDLNVPPGGDEDGADPDDQRAEAIAQAVKESGLSTDPSAMAFDASHALFREFDLPFTADEQVRKVVRFEAESHIPMDIDDVVLQHVVLRKTRDKSRILAAAVKKDDLLDRFDILEESTLDPMFVDMDVFALFHALVGTGVAAEAKVMAVVNAQPAATSLLFLVEGQLFAVRSLRMGTHGIGNVLQVNGQSQDDGGDDGLVALIDEESADDDEDDDEDDDDAPRRADVPEVEQRDRDLARARAHDYEGRLKREIRRTLTTLGSLGTIEKVYVTGSGSRIPGFAQAVGESFGVEAEPLDLLARVDHKLSDEDARRFGPDIGVALGVAYKLNGLDLTATDFRREECAYTRKFDQVKSPLIVLSFLLFLIVALGCINAFYQVRKVRQEYQFLLAGAQEQLGVLMEDVAAAERIWADKEPGPLRVQAITTKVDQLHEQLARQLGRSSVIPAQQSALAAWIEFSRLLSEHEDELGRFWVKKLEFSVDGRSPTMKISGIVESATKYNLLADLLRDDPLYTGISKQGTIAPTDDGYSSFSETIVDLDVDVLMARMED